MCALTTYPIRVIRNLATEKKHYSDSHIFNRLNELLLFTLHEHQVSDILEKNYYFNWKIVVGYTYTTKVTQLHN